MSKGFLPLWILFILILLVTLEISYEISFAWLDLMDSLDVSSLYCSAAFHNYLVSTQTASSMSTTSKHLLKRVVFSKLRQFTRCLWWRIKNHSLQQPIRVFHNINQRRKKTNSIAHTSCVCLTKENGNWFLCYRIDGGVSRIEWQTQFSPPTKPAILRTSVDSNKNMSADECNCELILEFGTLAKHQWQNFPQIINWVTNTSRFQATKWRANFLVHSIQWAHSFNVIITLKGLALHKSAIMQSKYLHSWLLTWAANEPMKSGRFFKLDKYAQH